MTATALLAELEITSIDWDAAKDRMIEEWAANTGSVYTAQAAYLSPIPAGTDIGEALLGARLLGMSLTPQGCEVAGVLNARNSWGRPLYDDVTVQIPRRATKTTSVQATLLGRCESRPGYKVIQSAQDGTRASMVFMDMVRELERATPDELDRHWTVYKSTGREYLEWSNGSRWWVAPPRSSSFRGLAADVLWFDESGELDPEQSADLEAGALPVMDTRPDGQVIKSGTPGVVRAGMFWTSLEEARQTPHELGIVDYSARESEVIDLEDEEDRAMGLLWRVHPGVACGLTTETKMRKRFRTMELSTFIREYLCVWPPDTSSTALDQAKWAQTAVSPVNLPTGVPVGFGYNVGIGGVAAAVAAAWYDEDGILCGQIMEYRVRSDWLPADLAKLMKAHPRSPLCYDSIGDNIAIAQALLRMPRTDTRNLKALQLKEVAAATATLASAVDTIALRHGTSTSLDKAVASATWRDSNGSRLFRRKDGQDISALLALDHAIAAVATLKKRGGGGGYAPA